MTLYVVILLWTSAANAQQIRQDVGTKILIPSSAKTTSFTSFLAVLNLDTQPNSVRIEARGADGSTTGQKTVTIPVGGRFRSTDILGELGAGLGSFGPIKVESTNNKVLAAVSEVASSQGPGGFFAGVNTQTAWQQGYLSEVIDTGSKGGPPKTYRTNIGLNTVDGSTANVSIAFLDNSGTQVGVTINRSVPGNGLAQINNVVRELLSSGGAITGQNGFLKITSDRPIIAWASKVDNGTEDPSFQIGIGAASTVASQIEASTFDMRNNLMFVGLALVGPVVLFLQRKLRKNFSRIDGLATSGAV